MKLDTLISTKIARKNPNTFRHIPKKKEEKEGGEKKKRIVMEFHDQILMHFSNQADSKGGGTLTWKHPLTWQER